MKMQIQEKFVNEFWSKFKIWTCVKWFLTKLFYKILGSGGTKEKWSTKFE